MAPSRKSRSINKRYSYINDVVPKKEVEDGNKNKRKRKLSDMLGSQWSKEELQRFYEAYRKCGKDWKKVSGAVRNRSVEMIEALYTMNKAYLSLPEGTASVAGLIAMMTDHYSVLEGSDSEQESHDGSGASQRAQKRSRGKVRTTASKGLDDNDPSHMQVGSSSGCLSLLKKKRSGSRPRAVGKRTPRVPVSFAYDRGDKLFSPGRPGLKLKADVEEDVAHEIALALTKASQTPTKKPGKSTSPSENDRRLLVESGKASATLPGSGMDEGVFEGSMEAANADFMKVRSMTNREGFGSIEIRKKGKKFYGKKPEVDETGNDLDDIKEACSGTEGQDFSAAKGKHEPELLGRSYSKSTRKRKKKVLFGEDESPGFDALQALADLSLMMPGANVETEYEGDHGKTSGAKLNEVEVATSRRSKFEKVPNHDDDAQEAVESTGLWKKKENSLASKTIKVDAQTDSQVGKFEKIEATDEMKRMVSKGKRSSPSAYLKQGKLGKQLEGSLSTSVNRKDAESGALATVQLPSENPVNLPTKVRSKRKMDVLKSIDQKDLKTSEDYLTKEVTLPISSFGNGPLIFKNKLSHCLSSKRVQRWCTFEWFYSAIDYPWFAKREFVEYLDHVGLGHIPRLTHVEWGVIRSSLGKPRRFSQQFLKEEKEKLNQYRDSVRKHYNGLRTGTREGLPADLARPLSVGQRVIAIHPRTREIHDGRVLTVDESRCRVQFDQPKLGVEFVMDIDCMPSNPLENMPASLSKRYIAINNSMEHSDHIINERSNVLTLGPLLKEASIENPENGSAPSLSLLPASLVSLQKQAKDDTTNNVGTNVRPAGIVNEQPVTNSQALVAAQVNQAKEADVRAIAELTRALEKKDAVVTELRCMNDDVLRSQDRGDNSLKESEPFKKQYAYVLLQLSEVNDQVTSSLISLRQRNTYEESFPVMPVSASADDIGGPTNGFDQSASEALKSTSHAVEIVDSSRTKAQSMVNAAMQAISSLKDGGNSVKEEAVDYLHTRLTLDESSKPTTKLSVEDSTNSNIAIQELSTSRTSNPTVASNAPGPMSNDMFDGTNTVIPADLIAHCVATLLMIQKCTEREFPPADVAQILDSAVTSLKPCCSENLPIYSEIQKCMGIIRSQILALIPT